MVFWLTTIIVFVILEVIFITLEASARGMASGFTPEMDWNDFMLFTVLSMCVAGVFGLAALGIASLF